MIVSRAIGTEPGTNGSPYFAERLFPLGEVGVNDLLVRVSAVSVNPVDTKVATHIGAMAPAQTGALSDEFRVLGFDAAGTVIEVGSAVTRFAPGDRVYYAGTLDRPGSNQSLHLVDERIVALAPASLSLSQTASLPLTAITAWESLFEKLRLGPESKGTMLVVGAAGGVGSVLVQLAKALLPGVTIIGTSSRPESERWVRELGADHVIDHHADLAAQLNPLVPNGVDWIFSTWSRGRVEDYASLLRPFGEIVGIDSGPLDVTALKAKSASWHWEYMFARANPTLAADDQHHRILSSVAALVNEGRIRSTETIMLRGLSVDSLTEAHRLVASGRTIGKVVISLE